MLDLAFEKLGAADFRYGCFHENEKSRKTAESFGFRFDCSFSETRAWDGSVRQVDSFVLTRDEYRRRKQ